MPASAARPAIERSTSVTPTGFQAKPVNKVARSHSVTIQAAARTRDEPIAPAPPPRQPGGGGGIDGEVEREQHHRDPAEPGRHRRLEGEGGRDPVQPEHELPDPEPPPPRQRGAQRGRLLDQPEQAGEGEDGQRPQPERREAERRDEAGEESKGKMLHAGAVWGWAAGRVNGRRNG